MGRSTRRSSNSVTRRQCPENTVRNAPAVRLTRTRTTILTGQRLFYHGLHSHKRVSRHFYPARLDRSGPARVNLLKATREIGCLSTSIKPLTRSSPISGSEIRFDPEIKIDQESCSNMNVNFFEWIREGVRKSVLLGVSDAIEQIGAPNDSEQLHPNLSAMLQETPKPKKSRASGGRKRLGKSLKDMDVVPAETK